MKNRTILYTLFWLLSICMYSQVSQKYTIWVRLKNEQAKPQKSVSTNTKTKNTGLNAVFVQNQVIRYKQALPFAKNPKLLEIYEIILKGNPEKFKEVINKEYPNMFKDWTIKPKPITTYEPSDSMWLLTRQNPDQWMWYLPRIQAEKAWDITHGSEDVTIAIIDSKFDILHPDLVNKFIVNYDPLTGIAHQGIQFWGNGLYENHGTSVASAAIGQTDGGGHMAAIGFDTRFYGYTLENNVDTGFYADLDIGIAKALHASNVMQANIISISWYYPEIGPDPDDALIIKEIIDNGTIICASAGNGINDNKSGELYPFGTGNDSRIIKVSTTGKSDCHTYGGRTNSHYPGVDICAPGEGTILAVPSVGNAWPYWNTNGETSFATPLVAGVCALMLSVNPCLTPVQTETILKNTADPILDANLFPGMVGAGRVNAYEAVKEAGTRTYINTTFTGNQYLSAGYCFNLTNVSIGGNSRIKLDARKEVHIIRSFNVPLGSTLSININPEARTNSQ